MPWAFFAMVLNFVASKWGQNGPIWARSGVWKTLKNRNFEEIPIFEGCDGSRMPKMHSGGVWNIFEKFLNFFQIFITPWPFSALILNFLAPK